MEKNELENKPSATPANRFGFKIIFGLLLSLLLGLGVYIAGRIFYQPKFEYLSQNMAGLQKQSSSFQQQIDQIIRQQDTANIRWQNLESQLQDSRKQQDILKDKDEYIHLRFLDMALRTGQSPKFILADVEDALSRLKHHEKNDGRLIDALEKDIAALRQFPEIDRESWLGRQDRLISYVPKLRSVFSPSLSTMNKIEQNTQSLFWWQRWFRIERVVPVSEKLSLSLSEVQTERSRLVQSLESIRSLFISKEYNLVLQEMKRIENWLPQVFAKDDIWDNYWSLLRDLPDQSYDAKNMGLVHTMKVLES
jgi:uncharacterized protein HemX